MSDQYCDSVIPGNVAIDTILETETTLAFYARQPLWAVHAIIVPKLHVDSLLEFGSLDTELIAAIMKDVSAVARHISEKHGQCRVATNVGAYQHTKHLHWHVYAEADVHA